jgi:hypothetical protein
MPTNILIEERKKERQFEFGQKMKEFEQEYDEK